MPVGAGIGALGSLGAAGLGFLGSKNAADVQKQALAQQQGMFNQGMALNQPFISASQSVLPTLQKLLTPGADQTNVLSQLPGFQFAQDWGQKAVSNIGSTLGLGGNTLAEGAKFATGTAQQGFGNLVNMLQGFVNTGAGAAQNVLGNAVQSGSNQANTFSNIAGASMGQYNALAGGLTGASNAASLPFLFNALKSGGSSGASNPNPGIYNNLQNFGWNPVGGAALGGG